LPAAAATIISVWLGAAVVGNLADAESTVDAMRTTGIFAVLLGALSIVPFLPRVWWIVLGISVLNGAAFGSSPIAGTQLALVTGVVAAFLVATTLVTLWGLEVVDELDRAKTVEARLQVAEERLRFSRDLHDVVGRGFSAIAVKSELAATLSRAGATDRAATEMDEVKTLAVESMNQMRELVRGYRDINLDGEVAGARSLLAAAGCLLTVEGDPARVPGQFHEVAAWAVREGTTNIVKHSAATMATISLGEAGMSLRNNGIPEAYEDARDPAQQTGLRGLAERLDHVGATLDTTTSGADFVLEIQWEKK
jgi:two-component system sensor histidine kinase DesK